MEAYVIKRLKKVVNQNLLEMQDEFIEGGQPDCHWSITDRESNPTFSSYMAHMYEIISKSLN